MTDPVSEAIANPDTYSDPRLYHDLFRKIRSDEPVRWTTPAGTRPFWVISKHADLVEIGRQPELFVSGPRLELHTIEEEEKIAEATGGMPEMTLTVLHMDGALHRVYRGLTQSWFMPANLKKLEQQLSQLAKEYVDRLEERGGACDFVGDFSVWYPLRVIMMILGLPAEQEVELLRLTRTFVSRADTRENGGRSSAEVVIEATREIFAYFDEIYRDRQRHPRDDLASVIANAKIDGNPINHLEAMSYYLLIGLAGHDTTASTISGGMLALIENPAELQKLTKEPALIPGAIDEFLRWVSPTRHFFRTAVADYTLRGKSIGKNDGLMLCFPSANRDEEFFFDPFVFNVERRPNPQVAFGFGAHVCLGQNLARMELRALFGELLSRLDQIELTGEPTWLAGTRSGGLTYMPVYYKLRATHA